MRRLLGGLLAAVVLLAGCSLGDTSDGAAPEGSIRPPTLAVSTQALSSARPSAASIDVLVTSPEGVDAPGLDAAVAVLSERPEVIVTVVAAAPDGTTGPGETMSGYPVRFVPGPAVDIVAAAVDELGLRPDLVFVGIAEGVAIGPGLARSPLAPTLRAATAAGIPALAVTTGSVHGADLAAAGVMVRSLFDLGLDGLLEPGARVLNVPACAGGLVRGPVAVDVAAADPVSGVPDCGQPEPVEPEDDVAAHVAGYASLVELDA